MLAKSTLLLLAGLHFSPLSAQSLTPEVTRELEQAVLFWEDYGEHCEAATTFPSKRELDGRCDDGDAVLFNGLLCMASYQAGCDAVRNSLDSLGQWWRSPRQVGGELRDKNSFSRDMAMGVMLYLTKTDDQEAAQLWLQWIESQRHTVELAQIPAFKISFLCHDDDNLTCAVTPAVWENLSRVWISIGLSPTRKMRNPYAEFGELGQLASRLVDRFGYDWQDLAKLEIKNTKPGYQLHLKGVLAYLVAKINQKAGWPMYDAQSIGKKLHEAQPRNLFFRYLHEGSSDALARTLMQTCPLTESGQPKRQWAWERADESEAWQKSMGWDCFFLGKVLLGHDDLRQPLKMLERPSIPGSHKRTIANLSFEEPAEDFSSVERWEPRVHQICQERIEKDLQIARNTTGLNLQYSNPFAKNLRDLHFAGGGTQVQAIVDCHYDLILP